MILGIAGDGDVEGRNGPDAFDEIGGVDIAARGGHVALADPSRRIAAQRHDVANAEVPIVADHLVDLAPRRGNAGQVRGRLELGLAQDARHGRVGALARRAARPIGDRDVAWIERLQPPYRAPQRLLHRRRLGREELEGYVDVAAAEKAALAFRGCEHHATTSTLALALFFFLAAGGFSPSQSDTVSLPPEGSGLSSRKLATLRPAPSNKRPS